MIRRWAKLLPYWVVMHLTKKFSPCTFRLNKHYVVAWRIDKGEWVVWNQENYNIMNQKEQEKRTKNKQKKRQLYEKLKREFDGE